MELNKKTEADQEQMQEVISQFIQSFLDYHGDIKSQKVIRNADGDSIKKLRKIGVPQKSRPVKEVVDEMVKEVYSNQAIMQHPRWFAFIPSPVSLYSWLGDIMTNAYNPYAGSWLQSPAASCIEQEIIKWLCGQIGYSEKAGGLFVSGGSMANLTALTAARNAKLTEQEYGKGMAYVSEQTHSSVSKGLRIIGFRADQICKIPTDDRFRMNVFSLREKIVEDTVAGRIPFAVIASAGTTNTGSIDPLNEIADICEERNIWMHVDGAYGASVAVSSKYRHLLDGIQRADSVSWDAHKWLMQTYSCGTILAKDKHTLTSCFHTHPEYLKDAVVEDDQVNFWDFGPELTRPARALKLWITLQCIGTEAMGQMIDHSYQLAEWAEDEIRKHEGWEIISPAQQAIVNFRYAPDGFTQKQLDEMNQKISAKILEDGYAGIVTTELHGKKVLRICALHPDATEEDMRSTICLLHRLALETSECVPNHI